jgi:hypothetical protein
MIYFKDCVNRYLNMKITLKITFTSEKIFSCSSTTLEILQEHFNINVFLRFIFSVECKCFCPNILNTMENRAISLVESSRDNERGGSLHTHLFTPLSCIITGGPAPILRSVNKVSPKTWRILSENDAISMTTLTLFSW